MSNDKQKRGRKKGSTDSINVSIETLAKYLPPTTVIPVRRLWIEQMETFLNVSITEDEQPRIKEVEGESNPSPARPRVHIEEEEL